MKKERCEKENKFGMCPYVTAQQLLSGKWAILIMQSLKDGAMRFNQIQKEIDITQATLTNQLRNLESEGLITRTIYPEVPPRVEYELTDIGAEFKPVLDSIEEWGNKYIDYLHQKNNSDKPVK